MGYGGALLWTGMVNNLKKNYPNKRVVLLYPKSLRDILKGKKTDLETIFENNQQLSELVPKVYWKFKRFFRDKDLIVADLSDPKLQHFHPERSNSSAILYRVGKHAIEYACDSFDLKDLELSPKIFFTEEERQKGKEVLEKFGLQSNRFICFEPNSKEAFTPNKAWPKKNWEELAKMCQSYLSEISIDIKLVQIGAGGGNVLEGMIDLSGSCSFRETGVILEKSLFFVSTLGGLSHLSRAVGTKNFSIVSAFEPKFLATYPGDCVFYKEQDCQNCGLLDPCPHSVKCMSEISSFEVFEKIKEEVIKIGKNS